MQSDTNIQISFDILDTKLQVRGCIEDNSKIIFLFLNENICCDPSLKLSQQAGSDDGPHDRFLWKIWIIIPKLSLLPLLTWCTVGSHALS